MLRERYESRPRWRGRIHQIAALVTPLVAVPFVGHATPGSARTGAAVFVASVFVLFATSAAYHRIAWTPRWALRMKRADHVAIFVLLAGTYTPVALVLLGGWLRDTVLVASWTSVVLGTVAASLGLFERKGVAIIAYNLLGWMAVLMAPRLIDVLDLREAALVLLGGVLYSAGAIGLALRRPDPDPLVFGYHEVWHVYTVLGVLAHGAALWSITG